MRESQLPGWPVVLAPLAGLGPHRHRAVVAAVSIVHDTDAVAAALRRLRGEPEPKPTHCPFCSARLEPPENIVCLACVLGHGEGLL